MQSDLLIPILVAILAGPAEARRDTHPLHGQSLAAQHRDETACAKWARARSGYDPARPAADLPDTAATLHAAGVQGSYYRARKTCLDGRGYDVN